MKSVFKILGLVSLIAAPSVGFAHRNNGANGEVDFSSAAGAHPASTAHQQIKDLGNAADNDNSHNSEGKASGLPDEAGPKE